MVRRESDSSQTRVRLSRSLLPVLITLRVPKASLGAPGPGWAFTVVLTGRRARLPRTPAGRAAGRGDPLEAGLGCDLVGLRRHDEVVPVQASDLVRPPGDGHAAPLGEQCRVMALFLCERADASGEVERLREV